MVSSQQGKHILPFAFLSQMAAPSNVFWDHEGNLHTNVLHWEGFPRLLWESLSLFHYTEPPQHDGVEYREEGDEDINYNTSTSTPAAPFPATPDAPPP
jgi:hypothetical protein